MRKSLIGLLQHSKGSLHLARLYADVETDDDSHGDHPFASPPDPERPDWCVCGRCSDMGRGRERENVCCGNRPCVTTKEYFLSTALDHNVLTLTIRLHADFSAKSQTTSLMDLGKLHIVSTYSLSTVTLVVDIAG